MTNVERKDDARWLASSLDCNILEMHLYFLYDDSHQCEGGGKVP